MTDFSGDANAALVGKVTAELQERFRAISELFARGADAEEIVSFVYWPDGIVVGEGTPICRGPEELLPLARPFVADMGRRVEFALCAPVLVSGNIASSLASVTCRYPDRPDARYFALYNWQRRGSEWKVIQEMLCVAV